MHEVLVKKKSVFVENETGKNHRKNRLIYWLNQDRKKRKIIQTVELFHSNLFCLKPSDKERASCPGITGENVLNVAF